jgi:uncharacterized Zn finger protein
MSFWGFRPYVSVAERRAKAAPEIAKLKKQGRAVSPVAVEGRKIAKLFWGKAWCDNLERYSDFANRLPRGRSYVCNGLVIDLQVARGKVEALVSGSDTYKVRIDIAVAAPSRWQAISRDCAGSVGSLVELLAGKLSSHVMSRVCRADDGLFPAPKEIKMSCSCPDWAGMCKHVAATLYGVGARLDLNPDLLFTLRGVDRGDLVSAGADLSITQSAAASERVLADEDLSALFGMEIEAPAEAASKAKSSATLAKRKPAPAPPQPSKGKTAKKTASSHSAASQGEEPGRQASRSRAAAGVRADRGRPVSATPLSVKTASAPATKASIRGRNETTPTRPRHGAQKQGRVSPPATPNKHARRRAEKA